MAVCGKMTNDKRALQTLPVISCQVSFRIRKAHGEGVSRPFTLSR
uniref:Uncharacterized protein n=1 Tax=Anguilla anguilla TaxID=7936 RepID=A0A0E9UUI9_ANGAN